MEIHDIAKRGDNAALLELLQDQEFNEINAKDKGGLTPLYIACCKGHTAFVRSLLSHVKFDANMVNEKCGSGVTSLHIAVYLGFDEIVNVLLAQPGIDLNTEDCFGYTPLTSAVKNGFESIVDLLLDTDEIDLVPDGRNKTPLTTAIESNQLTIAANLINAERRRSTNQPNETLLSWAVANDRSDIVRQFDDLYKTNPNLQDGDGDTPLSKAAERGNVPMVRLLLQNRAIDVNAKNKDGSTPLAKAALYRHKHVVQLLAAKDNTTLHYLVRQGNLELIDYLLDFDVDINHKGPHGKNALHIAVVFRKLEIARNLLMWGADIEAKDATGRTPLKIACHHGSRDIAELLLSRSACTIGMEAYDWQSLYNCYYTDHVLCISEIAGGVIKAHFAEINSDFLYEPNTVRSLIQVADFPAWSRFCNTQGINIVSRKDKMRIHSTNSPMDKSFDYTVSITVWVPHIRMFVQESGWDECGIAWTINDIVEYGGVNQNPIQYFSTLPDGWIPENRAIFFERLIVYLTTRWLKVCNYAEDHLSERRMKQLREKGRSDMIDDLASDAKNLAELRRCLRTQVHDAKLFIEDYGHSEGIDVDKQVVGAIEGFAKIDPLLQDLDQTIRDLLQLEFAWVSINEAHKSTSLGTSMKRLSWITFIFLPAMFASSLFGMNVNILENNPDWRWYLLFVTTTLFLTISVWLLFKYLEIETQVEKHLNRWSMKFSKRTENQNKDTEEYPV